MKVGKFFFNMIRNQLHTPILSLVLLFSVPGAYSCVVTTYIERPVQISNRECFAESGPERENGLLKTFTVAPLRKSTFGCGM